MRDRSLNVFRLLAGNRIIAIKTKDYYKTNYTDLINFTSFIYLQWTPKHVRVDTIFVVKKSSFAAITRANAETRGYILLDSYMNIMLFQCVVILLRYQKMITYCILYWYYVQIDTYFSDLRENYIKKIK